MILPFFHTRMRSKRHGSYAGFGAAAVRAALMVVVVALRANTAHAQIAVDSTSSASGDAASLSFPHTVGSDSDSLLMVGLAVHGHTRVAAVEWGSGGGTCSTTCTPATCLCPLTQVGTTTDGGDHITVQLWKLESPPAATGNIVVTLPSPHHIVGGATSFVGVNQTTALGAVATNSGNGGGPASVKVPGTSGKLVLDAVGTAPPATLTTSGMGQTQLYQAAAGSAGGSSSSVSGAGSTATGAPTMTMAWDGDAQNWAIIAVPLNPAPTPTGGHHLPTATPSPTPTPTPVTVLCTGDCNGDGQVTVNEIVVMVGIALDTAPLSSCSAGDANGDGAVSINEIVAAVNAALAGCPAA